MNKIFIDQVASEMRTIQDILRWAISNFNAAQIFYGHGTDNACDEALQLIFSSLSLPLDLMPEINGACLTFKERIHIIQQVIRRINEHIPVPYLTNKAWFCGLEFYVDDRVIIPRSPIGELITNKFRNLILNSPTRILDMCTGSGCIAIACAFFYKKVKVDAVDISLSALDVAKKNIRLHSMEQRITPIHSDLFHNLPLFSYDVIITNPPYVDINEIKDLPAEFYAEPSLGLIGGVDGLDLVQRILISANDYLSDDGILICEVGNSMVHLIKKYPQVPFCWLKFDCGGTGVFTLNKQQLNIYKKFF